MSTSDNLSNVVPLTEKARQGNGEYYKICRTHVSDPVAQDFLQERGISLETAQRCGIGFDPQVTHSSMLVAPISDDKYIGYKIDSSESVVLMADGTEAKDSEKMGIYNLEAACQPNSVVYIVQGIFDALAIAEVSGTAVALNDINNVSKFISSVSSSPHKAKIILCLDQTPTGQNATQQLKLGLKSNGISYKTLAWPGYHILNASEYLIKDRDAFASAVIRNQRMIFKPFDGLEYINHQLELDIENYPTPMSTGYPELDGYLNGGLYPGLYCLAASTSLGKTTFALNVAINVATRGANVLYFSMELSRLEIYSKILACLSALEDIHNSVSSHQIRSGQRKDLRDQAAFLYNAHIEDRLSVIDGDFSTDLDFVVNTVREYAQLNQCKPLVILDYLQVLQPSKGQNGERQFSKREEVTNMVITLKRLCGELNIPIFVISSINRSNYLNQFDYEALAESSGIEYTADVVLGLQLQVVSDDTGAFDSDRMNVNEKRKKVTAARSENPRKLELVCVKNRYGVSNFTCLFDYFTPNDLLEERGKRDTSYPHRTAGRTLDKNLRKKGV